MSSDLTSVRLQLCKLVIRKKNRAVDYPSQWQPSAVLNPENGQPFTGVGAWEYVARLLNDENQVLEEVIQDNPPGRKAYVMHVDCGGKPLYIKVRLGAGKILGRSFHYSETQGEQHEKRERESDTD